MKIALARQILFFFIKKLNSSSALEARYIKQFWVSILLIKTILSTAQIPQFKQHPLSFDGAQNVELTCLTHTQSGLIWLGSSKGVVSYNGIDYQLFTTDTIVSALYEDSKKRLWVGLKNGKILYFNHNKIQEWTLEEGHPSAAISGFIEDEKGRLWIATYGEGVYVYDNKKLYNFNTDDGLTSNDIYDIVHFQNGIWLATDQGISICRYENGHKTVEKKTTTEGLPDLIVKTFFNDKNQKIQCGFYDGSICISENLSKKEFQVPGVVNALAMSINGWQFVGTDDNGLFLWDDEDVNIQKAPLSVGRTIRDILPDNEGNIWFISDRNKLFSADLRFKKYDIDFKNIQSMYIHKKNNIDKNKYFTIGTQNGAFEYDLKTRKKTRILPENVNIISTFEDYAGNRWFGSYGTGLYCLTKNGNKMHHFTEKDGLPNGNIFSITSKDDTLWLATLGGISKVVFDGQKAVFKNYNTKNGLPTDFTYNIYEDDNHGFRIGTDGKGISYFDGVNFKNITHFQGNPIGAVVGIAYSPDKKTWVATADGRIFYEKDSAYNFVELPLSKNRIQNINGLTMTENGYLAVFKTSGLDLINPKTKEILPFGAEVGLGDIVDGLNVFTFDNAPRMHSGNLWFATHTALIKMDANVPLRSKPTMQLRGVSVFMQPIDFQLNKYFGYSQNYITFDYEGVWLTSPNEVRYRYKLDGIDPNWQTTREQQITYPNLPAGDYTFRVQSSLTDDFSGSNEAVYSFIIEKPFWKTWWFIVLSVAALYGIIVFIVKTREKRLKREEALRYEREQAEFEMLKSQINPHFLFNSFNTLIATIETDPKTAVEYTEKLSDFYRNILQIREKNTISITEELNLLENFIYILKKRFGIALIFDIKIQNPEKLLIPLTLQLLIENAVKHNAISRSRPLTITIIDSSEWLEISNNVQKKLESDKDKIGTGFGLESLKKRYRLLTNRDVQVKQDDDYFSVKIPI